MKIAAVLLVAMVVMMGQTHAWRFWRTAGAVAIGALVFGKRDIEGADFQAKYKAAVEDGVFTAEEIKSVFGVADNGVAEFIEAYDMDGDGTIQVKEYETVVALAESMTG
ncbi:hypothetical protein LOTGIDRAFT_239729, partial [Lottia gigantea]